MKPLVQVHAGKLSSDWLTGKFLAESRKMISSADDRPSLAWVRLALMLINACEGKRNDSDWLIIGGIDLTPRLTSMVWRLNTWSSFSGMASRDNHSSLRCSFPAATSSIANHWEQGNDSCHPPSRNGSSGFEASNIRVNVNKNGDISAQTGEEEMLITSSTFCCFCSSAKSIVRLKENHKQYSWWRIKHR